jgi:hypothetical protein
LSGARDKLAKALLHFAQVTKSKTLSDFDSAKDHKWIVSDQVDQALNQKLIDKVLFPLYEQLDIETTQIVDLCDFYFKFKPRTYFWLQSLDKNVRGE